MVPTYFPLIAQYLWMKIDFVATAQRADDPEALAAAEKLAQDGKTYLVFVRVRSVAPLLLLDHINTNV